MVQKKNDFNLINKVLFFFTNVRNCIISYYETTEQNWIYAHRKGSKLEEHKLPLYLFQKIYIPIMMVSCKIKGIYTKIRNIINCIIMVTMINIKRGLI